MSIEKLDEQVRLPLDVPAITSGDPKELANYLTELISELQEFRIHDIHERINLLLDIIPGGIVYLGEKDATGDYPNGTWRLNGESSSEYLIQLKESGTWTTKSTLSSAGIATLVGLVLSGLTASRLTSTDANKQLTSVDDLTQWIAGTDLEISVTDVGDGTVKIGIVDPLAVSKGGTGAASLTDGGIVLGSGAAPVTVLGQATNGQLPIGSTGADPVLAVLIGAINQVTVTNAAGSITLALPQDIHTGASPTFDNLTITTDASVGNDLTVTNDATVSGDLYVSQQAFLGGVTSTSGPISGLVSQWKMNDNLATTNVIDTQGANDGTAQQNTSALTTAGKINEALTFNGSSDSVNINGAKQSLLPFSFAAWIQTTDGGTSAVLSQGNNSANSKYGIEIISGGFAYLRWQLNTTNTSSIASSGTYNDGSWHHIVGVFSSLTDRELFVDSISVGTNVINNALDTIDNLSIGRQEDASPGNYFDGSIDDVRIYNKALSQAEIDSIYNSGTGTESNAVGSNHQVVATSASYTSPHGLDSLADLAVENDLEVGNKAWIDDTLVLGDPLDVTSGGTGLATLTDGGLMVGSGTGDVTVLAQATNGQLPIGSTGVDPVLATITGTASEIGVTNAAGSIILAMLSPYTTLVNDSMVDALHRHSELSASDGTPNPAVSVDADGNVLIGTGSAEELLHVKAADSVTGTIKVEGGKNTVTSIGEVNSQLLFGSNDGSAADGIGGRITSVTELTNGARVGMGFETYFSPDGSTTEHMRVTADGKVGVGTTTPDETLQVVGSAKIGDDNTNYCLLDSTGNIVFVGASGLPFAQIYDEDGVSTLALAAQDTFYQVTAFSIDGESNNATPDHTNDHITIVKAGRYEVIISIDFSQTSAVSIEYDFHVHTNNGTVDFPCTSAHRDTAGNQTIGNTGGVGIIDVAANDTVELWVERLSGGAVSRTITFHKVSMVLSQKGGT